MTPRAAEDRVLVHAPRGRDGALAVQLLSRHQLAAVECASIDAVIDAIPGAGCAIITSEALIDAGARERLREMLDAQPPWSDFPLILFAPLGGDRAADAFVAAGAFGNVTVLERPVHGRTLVSATVAALRARARQYEARAAIHRRDQFLAMLGHELRNPLAAIMLALETLHVVSGDVGAKQRMIIDRQARHLARLVDDLLDVARVTSGKVTLQRARVDLDQTLARCVQAAEMTARAREIALAYYPIDEPLIVDGDLVRLEEIFNNLIGNAIKYSPTHSRVDVRARRENTSCFVDVVDSGIGIAPPMLESVFDLFAQIESTLDRSQGGLGIGLTLVRSLVELHGGKVSAHSEGLGRGARFTVELPVARDPISRVRPTRPGVAAPIAPAMRVVLVDDNVDLLEMTKDLLESFGCDVRNACDGQTGLDAIVSTIPDIAFVDIGLPTLDGYQVAVQVRTRIGDAPYLVAMTGYGQSEDRDRALEAGFDAHLTKPVTADALKRALRAARR
jgi:signal transduction histidine kinase